MFCIRRHSVLEERIEIVQIDAEGVLTIGWQWNASIAWASGARMPHDDSRPNLRTAARELSRRAIAKIFLEGWRRAAPGRHSRRASEEAGAAALGRRHDAGLDDDWRPCLACQDLSRPGCLSLLFAVAVGRRSPGLRLPRLVPSNLSCRPAGNVAPTEKSGRSSGTASPTNKGRPSARI